MARSDVAKRYGSAMFDLGRERDSLATMREHAERLVAVLRATPEAEALLANRTIALSTRREVLERVLQAAGTEPTIGNLARLLLDRGRIEALTAIVEDLVGRIDAATGRLHAEVISALPLQGGDLERIALALGQRLGRHVELTARVDASLIGGLRVQVGQLVFDASVRNHLDRMRDRLEARRIS